MIPVTVEKKTRKMSPRWFLSLATKSGIKSAEAFLVSHREWLENGEMASAVAPILVKIDSKEVFPTPGLDAIMRIALDHVMADDLSNAEGTSNRSSEPKTEKPYVAVIMTASGQVATVLDEKKEPKELRASFEHPQDAERWCQRRLNEGSSSWHGEITWTKIQTRSGSPMVTLVERNDAIKALAPAKRSPFMHQNKSGGGSLKNKMTAHPTQVRFSRG